MFFFRHQYSCQMILIALQLFYSDCTYEFHLNMFSESVYSKNNLYEPQILFHHTTTNYETTIVYDPGLLHLCKRIIWPAKTRR